MNNYLNLAVNGEACQLAADEISTLQHLLIKLGYFNDNASDNVADNGTGNLTAQSPGAIVVARNQAIVPRDLYAKTELSSGDQIDILGAITGG